MKMIIESTSELLILDGVQVRVWKGVTDHGVACDVLVHRVRVRFPADFREFESSLFAQPAPAVAVSSNVEERDVSCLDQIV